MNLLEEQIKLEQESIDYGVDHYRSQVQEAKNTQRESTTLQWYHTDETQCGQGGKQDR